MLVDSFKGGLFFHAANTHTDSSPAQNNLDGPQCQLMTKLLCGSRVRLQVSLTLALTALTFCLPSPIQGQDSQPAAHFLSFLGAGSHKKPDPPAEPPLRSTQPPAFTVPVEQLGFSAPGQFYLGTRISLVSLDFLDENRLLFTFRVPGLMHRDPKSGDGGDERRIRAVVLRLPEGTVEAEAVWSLHDRARYLYMLDNGQFLLRDREGLQLGDASLQLKPFLHFPGPVLWVETDPSHRYLVTGSSEPAINKPQPGDVPSPASAAATVTGDEKDASDKPDMVLRIIRREDAKVMLVSRVRSAVHLPISSDGYLEALRSKGMAWLLNLNHFDGGSTVLGSVDSLCSPLMNFVSPQVFMVTGCTSNGDPKLVAMSSDGRRLWETPPSGPLVWPLLVMGPDGSRLARESLVTDHGVNAFAPLGIEDIKGQAVEVFDAASGKVAMRAQASPVFDAGGNVAISPNGKRVAMVMAGAIQIFDLPPPPPLPEATVNKAGR